MWGLQSQDGCAELIGPKVNKAFKVQMMEVECEMNESPVISRSF